MSCYSASILDHQNGNAPLALHSGQKRDPVPLFKLCGFNIVLILSYLHFRCIDWRVKKDKETTGPGYYEKLLKSEVSLFQLYPLFCQLFLGKPNSKYPP